MSNKKPNQAALAAALGLTPGRIVGLKKQGMPIYSVEAARAWRAQHIAPVPGVKPAEPPAGPVEAAMANPKPPAGYEASRARREAAEAHMAEMREAELAGQLIRVEAVRAVWAARLTSTRDALLQIPPRLAPVLAAETNLATVTQLLDDELRQALEQLSTPTTTATTEGNPHAATH
jgi:phage terminase Nu1 subunit (DNA packaging protein)